MGARLLQESEGCAEVTVSPTCLVAVANSSNALHLVNHDDFISRYRITNLGRDKVLKDI